MQGSPARQVVDVGTVIGGTYTIEALIGRGGMGAVFLASHNRLPGKKVAIKMLHAELSDDEVLGRFRREAQIASLLAHPNIVHVENFDVLEDGTPYLVLEYLQGETLAQRLRAGPLALEPAMSIVRQIGSALGAAHRAGVVHRDLKPQNVFLVPTELYGRVAEIAKVLDFGISKWRGSTTVKTQQSALLGTPQYMAPEQATGQHDTVDERTDIFALGAIVYEMLAGRPAFDGASIPEVVFKVVYEQPVPLATLAPDAPAAVIAAVDRAMAKAAAERFATVGEMVEALTGEKLPAGGAPSRPPDGGKRSQAAFDQTVGSGDHSAHVSPHAETVASLDQRAPAPAPATRRRLPWLVSAGAALAAAIVATIVIYRRPDRRAAPSPASSGPIVDKGTVPADASAPLAIERGDVAGPRDAEVAPQVEPAPPPRTDVIRKPVQAQPAEDGGDPRLADRLSTAERELRAKQWPDAERLSTSVYNDPAASKAQLLHADAINGIVACLAHNDEGGAMRAVRQLEGSPLRARVIGACHDAGLLRAIQ
ncbi:MAG TPA: protein kinase [Kofleriaceae bacterium]|nr:protein kinase [Kofleriaceae bacterium]